MWGGLRVGRVKGVGWMGMGEGGLVGGGVKWRIIRREGERVFSRCGIVKGCNLEKRCGSEESSEA